MNKAAKILEVATFGILGVMLASLPIIFIAELIAGF